MFEERELLTRGIEYLEAVKPYLATVVFAATTEVTLESLRQYFHCQDLEGRY